MKKTIHFYHVLPLAMLITFVFGLNSVWAQSSGSPIVIAENGTVTYGGGSASTYSTTNYYAINKSGYFSSTVSSIKTSGEPANPGNSITFTGVRGIDNGESTLSISSMPDGIDIKNTGWIGAINQQSSSNTSGESNLSIEGVGDIKVKSTGSYGAKGIGLYSAKNTDISKNKVKIAANSLAVEAEGGAYGIQGTLAGRTTTINITGALTVKSLGESQYAYGTNLTAATPTGNANMSFGSVDISSEKYSAYGFHCAGGAECTVTLKGNMSVSAEQTTYGYRLSGNTIFRTNVENENINISLESAKCSGAYIGGTNSTAQLDITVHNFTLNATATTSTGFYLSNSGTGLTANINSLNVTGKTEAVAISNNGGNVTGTFGTISTTSSTDKATAIYVNGGTVSIQNNINISASGATASYGMYVESGTVNLLHEATPVTTNITSGDVYNAGTIKMGYKGIQLAVGAKYAGNTGTIIVDMTGATENSYNLISASSGSSFGEKDVNYKFDEGKGNGYILKVKNNVLIAEKYNVTVTEVGYATFYYNKKLLIPTNLSSDTHIYAYAFDEETNSLIPTEISAGEVLPSNQGYVIKAAPGTYYFDYSSEEAGSYNSVLKGVEVNTPVSSLLTTGQTIYVLGVIDGKTTFYKYTDTDMPAWKAYFVKNDIQQ